MKKLKNRWLKDKDFFAQKEIGELQDFVKDTLQEKKIFGLKKGIGSKNDAKRKNEFTIETSKEGRRADFVIFINGKDVVIPVEVEKFNNINKGIEQVFQYQKDWDKKYAILTDGNEWRFYRSNKYRVFFIEDIFNNPKDFVVYWKDYIKPENYYIDLFDTSNEDEIEKLDLNSQENRVLFFEDVTQVIDKFKGKMRAIGAFDNLFNIKENEKIAVETSYAYLIQFILYKVLVDNEYKRFSDEYEKTLEKIRKALDDKDFYSIIINEIKNISEYISSYIYKPFAKGQKSINERLISNLKDELTIDDIAPWLDILLFINRYNFAGLRNEVFGFVYENYLKDLYQDKNKGQYFTDSAVVNFMLKELGYTESKLKGQAEKGRISIIDPSCGAGTFLYSAVDRIISAFDNGTESQSKYIENLVDKNIFGLDIEEFPLYLAEMSILMRLLPLIVNDNYENPIENKLKIFKTQDSISEFLDTGINSKVEEKIDLFNHLEKTALDYPSFMRDEKDLEEMLESLQERNGGRERFDYVIGNPPYIGYNQCCKQQIEFTKKIKDTGDTSLTLGNVYGMNLHSRPDNPKKYRPNPNLYAFFIALGLALLKEKGRMAYIIPQTILTAGDLDVVRYHLAKHTTIEKIITFDGSMFIGRGLKQNKPVPTSSLIFFVHKQEAKDNHQVKIINYKAYKDKQGIDFEKYINSRQKTTKTVEQGQLLRNVSNWNFLKKGLTFIRFIDNYNLNSNLSSYYNHKLAKEKFNSTFYFDGGYSIDEKKKSVSKNFYAYPKANNLYYIIKNNSGYWGNERKNKEHKDYIGLRQGNQGYSFLDSKYKIIWSYANAQKFFFVDYPVVWARNQFCGIGSDNKEEILYLFALLNSTINKFILDGLLKSENEKDLLISLTSIKEFIRTPKISKENSYLKTEIIKQVQKLLKLEELQLKDIVKFTTSKQKFSSVRVEGNNLILTDLNNNEIKQHIKASVELVKKLIEESYAEKTEISTQELKYMECVDFDKQSEIKEYLDNLVFALYFDIPVDKKRLVDSAYLMNECKKVAFYKYIHN